MAILAFGAAVAWPSAATAEEPTPVIRIVFSSGSTNGGSTCMAKNGGFFIDDNGGHPYYEHELPATIGPYPVGSALYWRVCSTRPRPLLEGDDSYGTWLSNGRPQDPNTVYGQPPCEDYCEGLTHTYRTAGSFAFWIDETGYRSTVVIGDPPPSTTTTTTSVATVPSSSTSTTGPSSSTVPSPAPTAKPSAAKPTAPPVTVLPTSTVPPESTTSSSLPDETTTSTAAPVGDVAIREEPDGGGGGGLPIVAGVGVVSVAGLGAGMVWRRRRLRLDR